MVSYIYGQYIKSIQYCWGLRKWSLSICILGVILIASALRILTENTKITVQLKVNWKLAIICQNPVNDNYQRQEKLELEDFLYQP